MSSQEETTRTTEWIIEQINAGWAELQTTVADQETKEVLQISLPLSLLPLDSREGMVLSVNFSIDTEASQVAQKEVQDSIAALSADDDGGDFSL